MLSCQRMKPEERDACAALAARSFADYEYFSVYVPNDRRRVRFLSAMMSCEFRANAGLAQFFTAKTDARLAAVAMLCAPDYRKPSDMDYIKDCSLTKDRSFQFDLE